MAAIKKAITAAAAVVSELVKGAPLGPQITERLSRAENRHSALEAALSAIALDVELGDGAAIEQDRQLRDQLEKVTNEVARLKSAVAVARARDDAAKAETEITQLQDAAKRYERHVAARLDAIRDLQKYGELARDAARRLAAANSLMRSDLPPDVSLPRGLLVGRDIGRDIVTVDEIATENANIIGHIRGRVERIIAAKRGQEAA